MGSSGVHFDENDVGRDFLDDVLEGDAWPVVEHRLVDYIDDGGYDDAGEAIAAAELVAAALGRPSPRLDPALREWAARHAADAGRVRDRAIEAVALTRDGSELSELWAEADEQDEWLATLSDLDARLKN